MGMLEAAFLIMEHVPCTRTLLELVIDKGRDEFLLPVAPILRNLHDAGLFHRDLHGGNILVQPDTDRYYVIDLHACRQVRRMSQYRRLWSLAVFFYSFGRCLTPETRERFLDLYDRGENRIGDRETKLQQLDDLQDGLYRRHMKSRTKRCLKNSGSFYRAKRNGWHIWAQRAWDVSTVLEVAGRHRALRERGGQEVLKQDRRTVLTVFDVSGTRVCVKEYRYPVLLSRLKDRLRGIKAKKGWVTGNGLTVRGIDAIRPVALLQRSTWGLPAEALLIMTSPPDYVELDRYVIATFGNEAHVQNARLERFVRAVAKFLAVLYQRRIYHGDLKTCNVMVRDCEDQWNFGLIDMDDVRLDKELTHRDVVCELVQLNTSTPLVIDARRRFRFLRDFCRVTGSRNEGDLSTKVVARCKGRQLVYVTNEGDVVKDVDWEQFCRENA
jgi:tRNA A-37 threonylcarbamoyl transferase component Bud32